MSWYWLTFQYVCVLLKIFIIGAWIALLLAKLRPEIKESFCASDISNIYKLLTLTKPI